jgi:hypothetical protein
MSGQLRYISRRRTNSPVYSSLRVLMRLYAVFICIIISILGEYYDIIMHIEMRGRGKRLPSASHKCANPHQRALYRAGRANRWNHANVSRRLMI